MDDTISSNGEQLQNVVDGTESLPTNSKKRDRGSDCSHKVIEKRRRDRINTSLGELSHLLPVESNGKQGSGKLEKAEILEKTVDYLKTLKNQLSEMGERDIRVEDETTENSVTSKQDEEPECKVDHFGGYKDCTEEVFRFLVNVEAMDMQQPCFQRLMAHLRHQIQLLMEPRSDLMSTNGKTNVKVSNNNRTPSKRSFTGTISSSSSSASSSMEETSNGSGNSSKAKRARVHSSTNKTAAGCSSSNGHSVCTSGSSDNENGSDNTRENQSDSAICLDDELADMPENTRKEPSNRVRMNRSSVTTSDSSRNENPSNSSNHGPSLLHQGSNIPMRGPILPTPYAMPSYALHPAGTHYIPIVLHPSVPLPTFPAQMPCGLVQPGNGSFGLPPQPPGMFGLPFPYMPHPGFSPYGYQGHAMGFPFMNGMCKDLGRQGLNDNGNGDNGSNGDDCSIESRNSSENIASQTDTPSPSHSGNESSNTDDGGS